LVGGITSNIIVLLVKGGQYLVGGQPLIVNLLKVLSLSRSIILYKEYPYDKNNRHQICDLGFKRLPGFNRFNFIIKLQKYYVGILLLNSK
jgi:hypothetical protein